MESLIKKLQSLQNKTTANGCTEQEALHAAEKVAELLDKYGLSIEQLKLDTAKDECSAGAFDLGSKRQTHPVVMCMTAIAIISIRPPKAGTNMVVTVPSSILSLGFGQT